MPTKHSGLQPGADGPILGMGGQICQFCNFAWTFFRGDLLLIPAVETEGLTFFISFESKSRNTNDATLYNNDCRHMSWTGIRNANLRTQ